MVDVIIGDIHVGNSYSRWRMLVEKLEQLEQRFDIETYVLAGDTFEIRRSKNSQRLEEEKNTKEISFIIGLTAGVKVDQPQSPFRQHL